MPRKKKSPSSEVVTRTLWEDSDVILRGEVSGGKIVSNELTVELGRKSPIRFKIGNKHGAEHWNILSSDSLVDFKVDRGNLSGAILLYLFFSDDYKGRLGQLGEKIKIEAAPGNFLVSQFSQSSLDEGAYYAYNADDGSLYDLVLTQKAAVQRLLEYNLKISSEDAILANRALIDIYNGMERTDRILLVGNDLHFANLRDRDSSKDLGLSFGKASPVYSCDKSKTEDFILEVHRRLRGHAKNDTLDAVGLSANETLQDLYKYIENMTLIPRPPMVDQDHNYVSFNMTGDDNEYSTHFKIKPTRGAYCMSWQEHDGEIRALKEVSKENLYEAVGCVLDNRLSELGSLGYIS